MRRKLHISILLFVILFPTGLECHGALKFRAVEGGNYAWLLDQAINCIAQDSHNFLWISTYGGLLRYDGATFQLMAHDPSDPGSIADNNAGKLLPDPERGGIWVATNAGLDYFDPVSGSFFHAIPGIYSKDMLFLGERVLCCSGSKVFLCSESKGSISFAPIDIGIVPISMCDYDGERFLAADHEGLYLLDKATFKVLSFAPSPSSTYSHSLVYYSRVADKIYVGNSIGTKSAVFSCRDGQLVKEDSFVPDNLHAVCDIDGKTLFGTNGNGLYILDRGEVSRMTVKDGLSSDVVTAFCYDTRGDLWLGLYRGGLMLNNNLMESFSVINDFKMVSSIIQTEDIIYAGTDSYGLGIVDRKSGKTRILNTSNSGIPGNNVVSMTMLDDKIWMAVYTKGLTEYNISTGKFKTWPLDGHDAQYVDNNKAWIVRHDDRGRIWVGGPSLFLFERESRQFVKVSGFDNKFISAISFKGNIAYVSTRNDGIFKLDIYSLDILERFNTQTIPDFPEKDVRYVFMDSHGKLWFNTQTYGLYSLDENHRIITRYGEKEGLFNRYVTTISEDSKGNLWMGTMNGLYYYSYTSGNFVNLRNAAYVPAQYLFSSSFIESDGRLYIGSTDGLVILDTGKMKNDIPSQRVTFTGVNTVSESPKTYPMFSSSPALLRLQPGDNFFDISYSVPEYTFPQSVRFSCRMNGLEKDWRYVGLSRSVSYTGLKAGDYEFEVRYSFVDEGWSQPSTLRIKVMPMWYATWWAKTIWALLLAAAATLFIRLRMHQQKIKNLKEVNDAKMDFFARVAHDLRTPSFLINTQLESLRENDSPEVSIPKAYLDSMMRNSRKLTRLINRIIDFRKLDSANLGLRLTKNDVVAFCSNLAIDYSSLCKKKDLEFVFSHPDHPVVLSYDAGKLESILENLISNSFKYTNEGGKVSLLIEEKPDGVYFCVSDTGIGIASKDKDRIFDNFFRTERSASQGSGDGIGLSMVKSFVEVHGGKIHVESKPDEGSSFSFTIPFGLTTEKTAPVIEDEDRLLRDDSATDQIPAPNPAIAHSILIIDDDTETTDLLERCLESSYRILKAHDGKTGLELVGQSLPDLVICDLDMPGTGGHEFLQRLRQDHKFNCVKALVLTGSNSEEDLLKSLEEGADTYLLKPVSLKELKVRINKLLKEKEEETVPSNISKEDRMFLMRCQEIIEQHLSEDDFNVKTMAAMLAMSHSSLYKKIRAITGLSLIGFVNDYKLHKAVILFRQGESNVTSVCEKCGFKDEKNFRELFRRKTGLTPKQYVLSLNTK